MRPRASTRWVLLAAAPTLLAGLLPFEPDLAQRWCWSGSWTYPIGDRFDYRRPGDDGLPGYRANRNVSGKSGHQGADLSNRQGGGTVRAAADGVVVAGGDRAWQSAYGNRVVLAHRLDDGRLAYTVYAHLATGSITVAPGDVVAAGTPLGRVGMTGRASAPHLHFEVRLPGPLGMRWERARFVDPLSFVAARLPSVPADSSWARDYLLWGQGAGLLGRDVPADEPLSRAQWWRMLAAATRPLARALTLDPDSLRNLLLARGILAARNASPTTLVGWDEIAADLGRLDRAGLRLPPSPTSAGDRRDCFRTRLGIDALGKEGREDRRPSGAPTAALACLALADLAGDSPPARRAPDVAGTTEP